MRISVQTSIPAPIEKVWAAYTTPADIIHWNAASDDWHTPTSTVDLRVGGQFSSRMEAKDGSFGFDFEGTYTKVLPNQLIEYEFGGRHAQVSFSAVESGQVLVTVSFDTEDENDVELQRQGWQAILDNFNRHVQGKSN